MVEQDQEIETTFGRMKIFSKNAQKTNHEKPVDNYPTRAKRHANKRQESQPIEYYQEEELEEVIEETSELNMKSKESNCYDFFGIDDSQEIKEDEVANPASKMSNENQIIRESLQEYPSDLWIGTIAKNVQQEQHCTNKNGTIPILKAEVMNEDGVRPSVQKIRNERSSNTDNEALFKNTRLKMSHHKQLNDEVLKWHKMTRDESVEILRKNICFFNEELGLLAIDKPYGLPSNGGPGINLSVGQLLPLLEKRLKLQSPLLMANRLDEHTTGLMLFATNKETAKKLRDYFNDRKLIKQYYAITKNVPNPSDGEIDIPLIRRRVGEITKTYLSPEFNSNTSVLLKAPKHENEDRRKAITKYRVIDSNNKTALVEIQPLTGVKHQIRSHLAYGLDCPILGDHKYSHHVKLAPQKLADETLKCLNIRQSKVRYLPMNLHSAKIILPEFAANNSNVFITAKLPLHFLNNLKRLKLRF